MKSFVRYMQYMLVALPVIFVSHCDAASRLIVQHHEMYLEILPNQHKLSALDIIRVDHDGSSNLVLELNEDARILSAGLCSDSAMSFLSGRGMTGWDQIKTRHPLDYQWNRGNLSLSIPDRSEPAELLVGIRYEIAYNDAVPDNPLNTEDPGYGVTGSISSRGTLLLAEARWYPYLDGSLPSCRVHVSCPAGTEAVTAGKLISRETKDGTSTSVWEITQPLPGIALSAGRYVVAETNVDGIPIYAYFLPESQRLEDVYLSAAADYVRLYSALIGPYPFPKFAVVENFFPTGYGFPSYTLLGSSVIRLPFIVKTSLGHEVAHSWFGNCVYPDHRYGNWSEGLVTYIADYLYKEQSSSEEAKEYREQILRDYATLVPEQKDFPLADFYGRHSPATRAVGYGKAAMVFHMLRRQIGDEAFWKGLQTVYQEHRFRTANWDDFAEAFSRYAGLDLKPYFRQWAERPGAPVIALKDVEEQKKGASWIVSGKLLQAEPTYALQVPMQLLSEGSRERAIVNLNGSRADFEIVSSQPPQRLMVDPDANLFRRLYPEEIPATVNSIRGSTSLVAVISEDLSRDIADTSKVLLESLGREDIPVLNEGKATPSDLVHHDVLFLGVPCNRDLLPPMPEELSVSSESFAIRGDTYKNAADALFTVLSDARKKDGHVSAIFLPLSKNAAAASLRKIPHYGRYSLLVFQQGANQMKTTWQPKKSPLIHEFAAQEDES